MTNSDNKNEKFDIQFKVSIMVEADKYLRIGHLPNFELGSQSAYATEQFCVFFYDTAHPEDIEILGSGDTIHEALLIFDKELKRRGFKTDGDFFTKMQ